MATDTLRESYRRADGVRITHDPYAKGMSQKYGRPGSTDADGFDPYADTVGPGIYGGSIKVDADGKPVIGTQYQNHNPHPGPVYDGNGYSAMSRAMRAGQSAVADLLDQHPELVNELSTGGATPLHMCGMSPDGQRLTAFLISRGADIEAIDTYGMRPLHRMASNNLPMGALALLEAGADVDAFASGMSAYRIAIQADAYDAAEVIMKFRRSAV